ncbi:MAG: hypothetical protein JRG91_20510 [Deltaproteobacteria bacterium]|nr:hypothetical protein [Deltaproteobacteria bacterium]
MSSYLTSIPSRVIGSLGKIKIQSMLNYAGDKQYRADEHNVAEDILIAVCKSIGIINSTDPNAHEYRLNELEKYIAAYVTHYPGFVEDFLREQPGASYVSPYIDDVGALAVLDNSIVDACGVGDIVLAAGVDTGWNGTGSALDIQDSLMEARMQIDALPVNAGDVMEFGLYNAATDFVMFHATRGAGAWDPWEAEIMLGGASVDAETLTAVPVAGAWHTFKVKTTALGAQLIYDEGEVTQEVINLVGVPPAVRSDPRAIVNSNAGGEHLYSDYIAAFRRTAY